MRILIDIGHPAHVHYYRNLGKELKANGHLVYWSTKNSNINIELLEYYDLKYIVLPAKKDGLAGKIINQMRYNYILLKYCKKNRIDIALGTSASVAYISKISKINSIVFDDDDDSAQPIFTRFVTPFISTLLSPNSLEGKRKRKDTIYYPGYHELAYLHPNRFSPDPSVLSEIGINKEEIYFIIRFNVFRAHHDIGEMGLSLAQKLGLINVLKLYGRVFITTEREIEPELKEYQLIVKPEKIHSLMAFATMFVGDSQTMTSEAAVLGVPSLKCNSFAGRLAVPNELEFKYGLNYSFRPQDFDKMLKKIHELMSISNLKEQWQVKKQIMLSEMIDVTSFWIWLVENYPKSVNILKRNPNYDTYMNK